MVGGGAGAGGGAPKTKLGWILCALVSVLVHSVHEQECTVICTSTQVLVHSANKSTLGSYSKLPSPPLLLRPFNTCALSNSGRPQQQQQQEEREATETIKSRNSRNLILSLSTPTTASH